jgi:hypothetical protein
MRCVFSFYLCFFFCLLLLLSGGLQLFIFLLLFFFRCLLLLLGRLQHFITSRYLSLHKYYSCVRELPVFLAGDAHTYRRTHTETETPAHTQTDTPIRRGRFVKSVSVTPAYLVAKLPNIDPRPPERLFTDMSAAYNDASTLCVCVFVCVFVCVCVCVCVCTHIQTHTHKHTHTHTIGPNALREVVQSVCVCCACVRAKTYVWALGYAECKWCLKERLQTCLLCVSACARAHTQTHRHTHIARARERVPRAHAHTHIRMHAHMRTHTHPNRTQAAKRQQVSVSLNKNKPLNKSH